MTQKRLLLLIAVAVVLAVAVSGTTAMDSSDSGTTTMDNSDQRTSCTKTSVNLGSQGSGDANLSSSVNLVVLVTGSSSVSTSQQIVQFNGQTEVDIDVDYGDESLRISGETVENGSLVLNVTRNNTMFNETVVVNSSDDRDLVIHVDGNSDVHISRESDVSGCSY